MANNENLKVEIEITEFDIEEFKSVVYENRSFTWTYRAESGEMIDIEFISEDEYDQRRK